MDKQNIYVRYGLALIALSFMVHSIDLPGFAQDVKSTALEKAHIDSLFTMALSRLKQNRPDEARDLLVEASKLAPTSAGIHCNLGLAYMHLANFDQAISEFEVSLKHLPTMTEAMINMAECYRLQNNLDKSIEWYQKYLVARPDDQSVAQTLASVVAQSKIPTSDKFGAHYLREAVAGGFNRWPKDKRTITVFYDRNSKVPGYRDEFVGIIRDCLSEWSSALGGRITFAESTLERNADLVFRWIYQPRAGHDDLMLNERGNASLTAYKGQISHGTIKLLTAPALVGGEVSSDIIRKACLHEIGHALGIEGHSPNNNDVMFYLVESPTVQSYLTPRDVETIQRLYNLQGP